MRTNWAGAALLLLSVPLACAGDEHDLLDCSSDEKKCSAESALACVSKQDPNYGCGEAGCVRCALVHATTTCGSEGQCIIDACAPGWENCNGADADGCETNTASDVLNCGSCGLSCGDMYQLPNVSDYACGAGLCQPLQCVDGWANEDNVRANGCEAEL